jgi:hypothetical protein
MCQCIVLAMGFGTSAQLVDLVMSVGWCRQTVAVSAQQDITVQWVHHSPTSTRVAV